MAGYLGPIRRKTTYTGTQKYQQGDMVRTKGSDEVGVIAFAKTDSYGNFTGWYAVSFGSKANVSRSQNTLESA